MISLPKRRLRICNILQKTLLRGKESPGISHVAGLSFKNKIKTELLESARGEFSQFDACGVFCQVI